MKISAKIVTVFLVLLSTAAWAEAVTPKANIVVVPANYQHLFAFKVDRKFKGAMVEVYHSDGDLVAAKPLENRKMIINFCYVKSGLYTIKVIKNNQVQEFYFQRK